MSESSEESETNDTTTPRRSSRRRRKTVKRFSPTRTTTKAEVNASEPEDDENEDEIVEPAEEPQEDERPTPKPQRRATSLAKATPQKRRGRPPKRKVKLEKDSSAESGDDDEANRSSSKARVVMDSEDDTSGLQSKLQQKAERYYVFEEQNPLSQPGVHLYDRCAVTSIEQAVALAVDCADNQPDKLCSSVPNGMPPNVQSAAFVLDMSNFTDDARLKFDRMFDWRPTTEPNPIYTKARRTDAPRLYKMLGPVMSDDGANDYFVKHYEAKRSVHDHRRTHIVRSVYWVYMAEDALRATWAVIAYHAPKQPAGYNGYLTKKPLDVSLRKLGLTSRVLDEFGSLSATLEASIKYNDSSESESDERQRKEAGMTPWKQRRSVEQRRAKRVFAQIYDFDRNNGTSQQGVAVFDDSTPVADCAAAVRQVHRCVAESPQLLCTDVPWGLPKRHAAAGWAGTWTGPSPIGEVYVLNSEVISNDQRVLVDKMAGWILESNVFAPDQPALLPVRGPFPTTEGDGEEEYYVKQSAMRRRLANNQLVYKNIFWLYDQPEALVSRYVLVSYEAVAQPAGYTGSITTYVKGSAADMHDDEDGEIDAKTQHPRVDALDAVQSQSDVAVFSACPVVDNIDAVRNVVSCVQMDAPQLCTALPACMPPNCNAAVFIVDGSSVKDQADVRQDGMRHWRPCNANSRLVKRNKKPLPFCLDIAGPFTVDGTVNYYVRELSVVRLCDDPLRTCIKKDIYWVYDKDSAYDKQMPATWLLICYRIMCGALDGLVGRVPPALQTVSDTPDGNRRRVRAGRPIGSTRNSSRAGGGAAWVDAPAKPLPDNPNGMGRMPMLTWQRMQKQAAKIIEDENILNHPKFPERYVVACDMDSYVVIKNDTQRHAFDLPYSCTCDDIRQWQCICAHTLAVATSCDDETAFKTHCRRRLRVVQQQQQTGGRRRRCASPGSTQSSAGVPVTPLEPETTFAAAPESDVTMCEAVFVYSDVACVALMDALTSALTCQRQLPHRLSQALPFHMPANFVECTFVCDAAHFEDQDAIKDTMGDWDANVKNYHMCTKAPASLGGQTYSVKKRYQKNCHISTDSQLSRHIYWIYAGRYGRETRIQDKKAKLVVISYKWNDGQIRPMPDDWFTTDRPAIVSRNKVCPVPFAGRIDPPIEPCPKMTAKQEAALTGSDDVHLYSRDCCQNIQSALTVALRCSSDTPNRLCTACPKRLPKDWTACTYIVDGKSLTDEDDVQLDEMGDWSGPHKSTGKTIYRWKQTSKMQVLRSPPELGAGSHTVKAIYQKNFEPACEGQLSRHLYYVFEGELDQVECRFAKPVLIVVTYEWADGVVRELPAEMKTSCWVKKRRYNREPLPQPKYLECMVSYRDVGDVSHLRLPNDVHIYSDQHCLFIDNAIKLGLEAERIHSDKLCKNVPNGPPEGFVACTYVIDGRFVFDRDVTCDGIPNWTTCPSLGIRSVVSQYAVQTRKYMDEDNRESVWTVKKNMVRNGHESTDYKLNRYIYHVYEGKVKPKQSKARFIIVSYYWIDEKPRELPGFLTEDNRRIVSALETRRRPSEVMSDRREMGKRRDHHSFRYKAAPMLLPKPYRRGLGREFRQMERQANRLLYTKDSCVKQMDASRWEVRISDTEQVLVTKLDEGEYRCNCEQFAAAKFTCAHCMLMVCINDELDQFRAFVYREVERPQLPDGGVQRIRRGRPYKRRVPTGTAYGPDGLDDGDDEDYVDDTTGAAFHPEYVVSPKRAHLAATISAHEYGIIMQKAADFYAEGLVLQYPKEDNLYAVMVDRTTFNVTYRGGLSFVCNCDQFEALVVVCMHSMAVALSLGVAAQYRRKCEPYIDKLPVNEDQHQTVLMLDEEAEDYW